jgi:hypothetical protein
MTLTFLDQSHSPDGVLLHDAIHGQAGFESIDPIWSPRRFGTVYLSF